MAETTQLELVTPANIMVQKPVQMVVAPGSEGLFGVLPRHAPLLSDLTRLFESVIPLAHFRSPAREKR